MELYGRILRSSFSKLSKELGVTEEFIIGIYEDKYSWSFVSKLAQFIEGVFTKALVTRLNEPSIRNSISNLSQITRINLCYDLEIINKEQKLLFLTIAEIRNSYIHEISNFNVDLKEYFSQLKTTRTTEIFKRFKPFFTDVNQTIEEFYNNPKENIFTICTLQIQDIYTHIVGIEAERKHEAVRVRSALTLLPKRMENTMYLEDTMDVHNHTQRARKILREHSLL